MKTVEDAVRELDGIFPETNNGTYLVYNICEDRYTGFTAPNVLTRFSQICTRPEFEAAAASMGYPRVTLQQGDYVRCEDIGSEAEYYRIAKAFMAAGATYPTQSATLSNPNLHPRIDIGWGSFGGQVYATVSRSGKAFANFTRQLTPAQALNATNSQPQPNTDTCTEWHERGELPPVGCKVEMADSDIVAKATVLAHDGDTAVCYVDVGKMGFYEGYEASELHPLRTDRERWVERVADVMQGTDVPASGNALRELGEAVYDALLSGDLPTPGGDA